MVFPKAYIKRRRLPDTKKVMDSKLNSSTEMNYDADGKSESVKQKMDNLIKDSTRTCYIGQSLLYDVSTKRVDKKVE